MTLIEAVAQGIARVRDPKWAFPDSYLKLDLIRRGDRWYRGPWLHLYSRTEQELIGEPTPQTLPSYQVSGNEWEPYTGALDKDDSG